MKSRRDRKHQEEVKIANEEIMRKKIIEISIPIR
jgi:hypothetical protein